MHKNSLYNVIFYTIEAIIHKGILGRASSPEHGFFELTVYYIIRYN